MKNRKEILTNNKDRVGIISEETHVNKSHRSPAPVPTRIFIVDTFTSRLAGLPTGFSYSSIHLRLTTQQISVQFYPYKIVINF